MTVESKLVTASKGIPSPRCSQDTSKSTGPKARRSQRQSLSRLGITIKSHQYRIENPRALTEDLETRLKAKRQRTLNSNQREESEPERRGQLQVKEKKKKPILMQKKLSSHERTH
jgi:hypothetical protein